MDFTSIHNQTRFAKATYRLYEIQTILRALTESLYSFSRYGGECIEKTRLLREARGIVDTTNATEVILEKITSYSQTVNSLLDELNEMLSGIDYSDLNPIDLIVFNHNLKTIDSMTASVEKAFHSKGKHFGVAYLEQTNAECMSYFETLKRLRVILTDLNEYETTLIPRASTYESSL